MYINVSTHSHKMSATDSEYNTKDYQCLYAERRRFFEKLFQIQGPILHNFYEYYDS